MVFASRYPPETRQAVEALLKNSELTMFAIAERTSVAPSTVQYWNREARIRPCRRGALREADTGAWTLRRKNAVSRLFEHDDIDPGDLAEALGSRRSAVPALRRVCGLPTVKARRIVVPPGAVPEVADLGLMLRAHIARQIAAFDAGLNGVGQSADSAKVLRDLGGLKRLLDDLAASARQSHSDGDADGGSPQDLAALRARIAQRYEAFEAERHDAGLSEPAGPGGAGEPGA